MNPSTSRWRCVKLLYSSQSNQRLYVRLRGELIRETGVLPDCPDFFLGEVCDVEAGFWDAIDPFLTVTDVDVFLVLADFWIDPRVALVAPRFLFVGSTNLTLRRVFPSGISIS